MYAQFFAGYLLKENYLSKKQVIDSLKAMNKSKVKLGVLAMNAGYLTAKQVEKIHDRQTQEDKRMGDIALELGYLTREQIDELLQEQPSGQVLLAQTLMDNQYMDNASYSLAFSKFKKEYTITDDDIKNSDITKLSGIVKKYYGLGLGMDAEYLADYIVLLFNNLVRFIGDDFVPGESNAQFDFSEMIKVKQKIVGSVAVSTLYDTDEITFIQMSSRFAGEEIPAMDEYTKAAGEDFMNLHNGLFLVSMSNNRNIELQLDPPCVEIDSNKESGEDYRIPVIYSFGNIEFLLKLH